MDLYKLMLAIAFISISALCILGFMSTISHMTESDTNKIDKEKCDSLINKAYLEGYRAGVEYGKQEAIFKKHSPNEIREALGLDPIKENETNV